LNIPVANNVKSSLHVTELQNILNFKQIQQSLQQNMQQSAQQNTTNMFPVSGIQLAARQTFSLNCAATSAWQRMVASFSCGILTQRNQRVDEQELMQSIVELSNEATEVIGCTPIVHCNGFSSAFCLSYP
jgi:hypothetical protein